MNEEMLKIVNQICAKNSYDLLYCCVVGSAVYFADSPLKSNDTDLLCVIDGQLATEGSLNSSFKLCGADFDLQIIHKTKYQELLTKNHMFYLESWLSLPKFILFKRFDFVFELRRALLLENLQANIEKTLQRAEKNFLAEHFLKGKKQILHIIRISMFAQSLLSEGGIRFGCANHLFELLDDSPISMEEWVHLLSDLYPDTAYFDNEKLVPIVQLKGGCHVCTNNE